jgi:hypothetical protein
VVQGRSGDRGRMHVGLDLGLWEMGGRLRLLVLIKRERVILGFIMKERKKSRLDYGVCILGIACDTKDTR